MHDFSTSEENYIKTIYSLSNKNVHSVSTNELAVKLSSKPSSITDMLKRLSDKKLIEYQKYQGCKLSETGLQLALTIIRKHRLWEVFLVEKLNFKWDEVHEIAEQLEHVQSTQLTDQLDAYLNFPLTDPHGDPIPNKHGEFAKLPQRISLSNTIEGKLYQVLGVEDGQVEFLQYLNQINLELGTKIMIGKRLHFDGSMWVHYNKNEYLLSAGVIKRIAVCEL